MTHVMIDIETLGQSSHAVIVALGAVKFGNGQILDSFYQRIDAQSCVSLGMKLEVEAMMFWLKQPDAARLEITKPGQPVAEVLAAFAEWFGPDSRMWVWGNGATFDNVILDNAYRLLGRKTPWRYSSDRCYRTVKALFPSIPITRTDTHHNALDDATSQAQHLMQIFAAHPEIASNYETLK